MVQKRKKKSNFECAMCEKLFTTRVDCLLHILTDHDIDKRDGKNFILDSRIFSLKSNYECAMCKKYSQNVLNVFCTFLRMCANLMHMHLFFDLLETPHLCEIIYHFPKRSHDYLQQPGNPSYTGQGFQMLVSSLKSTQIHFQ